MAQNLIPLTEIKLILRSMIVSSPHNLTIERLNKDYKESEGRNIPFAEFGFDSLETFLRSIDDVLTVNGYGFHASVSAVRSKRDEHITQMISKQKNTTFKKKINGVKNKSAALQSQTTLSKTPFSQKTFDPFPKTISSSVNSRNPNSNNFYQISRKPTNFLYQSSRRDEHIKRMIPGQKNTTLKKQTNEVKSNSPALQSQTTSPNTSFFQKPIDPLPKNISSSVNSRNPDSNQHTNAPNNSSDHKEFPPEQSFIDLPDLKQDSSNDEGTIDKMSELSINDNTANSLNSQETTKSGVSISISGVVKKKIGVNPTQSDTSDNSKLKNNSSPQNVNNERSTEDLDKVTIEGIDCKQSVAIDLESDAIPVDMNMGFLALFDFSDNVANSVDKISPLEIPDEIKSKPFSLYITEVNSPSRFWFQYIPQDTFSDPFYVLNDLDISYEQLKGNELNMYPCLMQPGQICAAMLDEMWSRAEILETPKNDQVKILLFDYGFVKFVSVNNIKLLLKEYCDLPRQALCGSLANIKPADEIRWTHAATKFFLEKTNDLVMFAIPEEIDEKDQTIRMTIIDKHTGEEVNINKELVKQNYAKFEDGCEHNTIIL